MKLRSKYAVRLYEILESYVNRRDSDLTIAIDEFRSWLKVPDGAYADWKDFKRNVVLPAVNEINRYCEEVGFVVGYAGVREGKAYTKIRFTVTKTAARDDRDSKLQGKARRAIAFDAPPGRADAVYEPTDAVLDQVRAIVPGWDRQALLARYKEWSKGKVPARNPHGAFLGWVKRFTKGKAAA
jgi:plasmid replication initiation protein